MTAPYDADKFQGWIKLNRGTSTNELLKRPKAFTLLSAIALRAWRSSAFNEKGLVLGEAFMGDHHNQGLTRGEYRANLRYLEKHGFITIRTTNRGSVVKLQPQQVFDINADLSNPPNDRQATTKQPASNHRATTNKKGNKLKNHNNEKNPERNPFKALEELS